MIDQIGKLSLELEARIAKFQSDMARARRALPDLHPPKGVKSKGRIKRRKPR